MSDVWAYTKFEFYQDRSLRPPSSGAGLVGAFDGTYRDLYDSAINADNVVLRTSQDGPTIQDGAVAIANLGIDIFGIATASDVRVIWNGYQAYQHLKEFISLWDDRTTSSNGTLSIKYPHPNYNRIRIIFEAYSVTQFSPPNDAPGAPSVHLPATQNFYSRNEEDGGPDRDRTASPQTLSRYEKRKRIIYEIDLSQLRRIVGDANFYQAGGFKIPFQFAIRESEQETVRLGTVHSLLLKIEPFVEPSPLVETYITFLDMSDAANNEGIGRPIGNLSVARFVPAIHAGSVAFGEAIQIIDLPLKKGADGDYRFGDSRYDLVTINFAVVSNRTFDPNRPQIQFSHVTTLPSVLKPVASEMRPFDNRDAQGRSFKVEGAGGIGLAFAPRDITLGRHDVVLSARQDHDGSVGVSGPLPWRCELRIQMVTTISAVRIDPERLRIPGSRVQ